MRGLAWSPDGRSLLAGSSDEAVLFWDWGRTAAAAPRAMRGYAAAVTSVASSPDGRWMAAGTRAHVRVWEAHTHERICTIGGHRGFVSCLAWSPDGRRLATGPSPAVFLWDPAELRRSAAPRPATVATAPDGGTVVSIAWAPDSDLLALGTSDGSVHIWSVAASRPRSRVRCPEGPVRSLAWSPDGRRLATGTEDGLVFLWDTNDWVEAAALEGHVGAVTALEFSSGGTYLACQADGIRLWESDAWRTVAAVAGPATRPESSGLAFHPAGDAVAVIGEGGDAVEVFRLDRAALDRQPTDDVRYTNAKIVLAGDAGVGKTARSRWCSPDKATGPPSRTHGRHVWPLWSQEVLTPDGATETREILLWDLAGQPGYRLTHQLYLGETAIAIVVFDAHSETDPFAGVRYWDRALRQAHQATAAPGRPPRKLLVAARTDRGGIGVSRERVEALRAELDFDLYFFTSAKEGWSIPELSAAIEQAVDWDHTPRTHSTALFHRIRMFLNAQRESGRLTTTVGDLYREFLHAEGDGSLAAFAACVRLAESRGLVHRFQFGDLLCLQPERIDAYASAIAIAARDEPDGLGCVAEDDILACRFPMSADERAPDRAQETLLLYAAIQDLLRHQVATRETSDRGPLLIFPSQFTREHPDHPEPEGKTVTFAFEGPTRNAYATLVVRLSNCGFFRRTALWKDAADFNGRTGGACGVLLRETGEGRGELCLYYDEAASAETRANFEGFIVGHLDRWAVQGSLRVCREPACAGCGLVLTQQLARLLAARGASVLVCPVCGTQTLLPHDPVDATPIDEVPPAVPLMNRVADARLGRQAGAFDLRAKRENCQYDVFLSYNRADRDEVLRLCRRLMRRRVLPWIDVHDLSPGLPWIPALESVLACVPAAAVLIGGAGFFGPWQEKEHSFCSRGKPVTRAFP